MKIALQSILICLALGGAAARAQIGIYGKFDYTRYTDHSLNEETSYDGVGAGIYYDLLHLGPAHLGLDLRGSQQSENNLRFRTGLAGIRLAAKLPAIPIRPYVQVSAGAGGGKSTGPFAAGISGEQYHSKFLYEVLGGLDYTLIPHVDFRAIELGYGRETGSSGTPGSNPASTLFLLSTGLVVRFR
jgi:hypothetical protein